mmetsp:Transcript_118324/g.339565  ORF Transcript_118324/g.339565 Transcript_118324/m.339565 type:complete len:338 (-) Transcript_118324:217-1230(-)
MVLARCASTISGQSTEALATSIVLPLASSAPAAGKLAWAASECHGSFPPTLIVLTPRRRSPRSARATTRMTRSCGAAWTGHVEQARHLLAKRARAHAPSSAAPRASSAARRRWPINAPVAPARPRAARLRSAARAPYALAMDNSTDRAPSFGRTRSRCAASRQCSWREMCSTISGAHAMPTVSVCASECRISTCITLAMPLGRPGALAVALQKATDTCAACLPMTSAGATSMALTRCALALSLTCRIDDIAAPTSPNLRPMGAHEAQVERLRNLRRGRRCLQAWPSQCCDPFAQGATMGSHPGGSPCIDHACSHSIMAWTASPIFRRFVGAPPAHVF